MVALSTMATIIASQAMISGAFSLTRQAVQIGYCPRVTIIHTSAETEGQIYIPEVNRMMMVVCIGLVLGLRHSSGLAACLRGRGDGEYGNHFGGLLFRGHPYLGVVGEKNGPAGGLFLVFDITYFGSNLLQILRRRLVSHCGSRSDRRRDDGVEGRAAQLCTSRS